MANETYQLAILLTLKDAASGSLDRFSGKLRSLGKDGKIAVETLDNLRAEMNKGIALTGIGSAGLGLMYRGVQVAGDFQTSMTDLRTTLSQVGKDGNINFDVLGKDMLKAEAIAMKLGNALPGTSEDVLRTIQTLKQNGLATETIINGAADAVYNLAVANKEVSTETAKNFAQFGQLFNLKSSEYISAADTFSRLYTSSGINSSELIEAAKYFQGRSGAALGLSGLDDAEKTIRVLGLLRKQGLEGSIAGTAFNNLFSGYFAALNKKDNPLELLKKLEGIDIKFFDGKGNFAGIDNLFKQLEPLQKLSEEKRATYLKNIFGEEGMSAATAILKTGAEGWRQYNAEQEKTISLQQKNAEKAKDFNNQVEALSGSVKNLVVTGFEPLLPSITSAVNSTNQWVGSIQSFAKEHPTLVETLGTIALYGTTAIAVVGGFKAMTNAWRIFSITSSMSREGGLISYLTQTAQATDNATKKVAGFTGQINSATNKVGLFQKVASSPITITLVTAAAEYGITTLIQHFNELDERINTTSENSKNLRRIHDELLGSGLLYNAPGNYGGQKDKFDEAASHFLNAIKEGRTLETSLYPQRSSLWEYYKNLAELPYGSYDKSESKMFNPTTAAYRWGGMGLTGSLQDPNVLARAILQIQRGGGDLNLNQEGINLLLSSLEKIAGKDDYKTALDILRKENNVPNNSLLNQFKNPFAQYQYKTSQFESPILNKSPVKFEQGMLSPFNRLDPTMQNLFGGFAKLNESLNQTQTSASKIPEVMKQFQEGTLTLPQTVEKLNQSTIKMSDLMFNFQEPAQRTIESVFKLGDETGKAVKPIANLGTAANNAYNAMNEAAGRFRSINVPQPNFVFPNSFMPQREKSPTNDLIKFATRSGDYYRDSKLDSEQLKNQVANIVFREKPNTGTQPISVTYSPTIQMQNDGTTSEGKLRQILADDKRAFDRKIAKLMQNSKERS